MNCLSLSITGVVQGVGFRPFVYNLAREMAVKGFVTNTAEGVALTIEGDNLDLFLERLRKEAPPLSRIRSIDIAPCASGGFADFRIRESSGSSGFTLVSADVSVCADCSRELYDPLDRRFLYPFINCTNCGPRFSITTSVPYDRPNTTMAGFTMCPACEAEYRDPSDRRFHAQPNACGVCGPSVTLIAGDERRQADAAVFRAAELLKEGVIVAVKGLGGFHLACDATNEAAVRLLRQRKRRVNKPFALMSPDMETIRRFCHVSAAEEQVLSSPRRPVVLLKRRDADSFGGVAPGNSRLGFMLPYTPLHHLLLAPPGRDGQSCPVPFEALVMTSGNLSEEPIMIDNGAAMERLRDMADSFLIHDRDIFMRVDDSVVRVDPPSRTSFVRRARGFVPEAIPLPGDGPDVLGCGADLKNTFTITRGGYAICSQHIGDMENLEALRFFEEALRNLTQVYRARPVALAHDLHPGYLSTKWALQQQEMKPFGIQHHYAHVASVMAEKGLSREVIGVAFDGTGYGDDGTLWGGEFLIADLEGFRRAGHLDYVPLPGGESAIREPWKTAVSYVRHAAGTEALDYLGPARFAEHFGGQMVEDVLRLVGQREFSPLTSGAGRLFDAVSALLGVCYRSTFEGEAAIALEAMVLDSVEEDYPVDISFRDPMTVDFSMAILRILDEMTRGVDRAVIATRFHNSVVNVTHAVVLKLAAVYNLRDVVLSGGVFQNAYLLTRCIELLTGAGMRVHVNEMVPCNDAGISLGQAYIIRERLKMKKDNTK